MSRRTVIAIFGLLSMICLSLTIGIIIGVLVGYKENEFGFFSNSGFYNTRYEYGDVFKPLNISLTTTTPKQTTSIQSQAAKQTTTTTTTTNEKHSSKIILDLSDKSKSMKNESQSLSNEIDNKIERPTDYVLNKEIMQLDQINIEEATKQNCNHFNSSLLDDLKDCNCGLMAACLGPSSAPNCLKIPIEANTKCEALRKCTSRCAGIYFDGKSFFKFNCFNYVQAESSNYYLLPTSC